MARSDFGEVYSNGVPIFPDDVITGNTYWVSSVLGSADNTGTSKDNPVATIAQARAKCTASNGDCIMVMPYHTETVASAGAIALSVAGVKVKGLGRGSSRPTITLATLTTASVTITAADVSIENIIFKANLDNIATCFTVSAKDATIKNCEFRDGSATLHFLSCILTDAVANSCDGLTVVGCKRFGLAAANLAFISVLEDNDRVSFIGNVCIDAAVTNDVGHFLIMSSKNLTNTEIAYNKLILPVATSIAVGQFMTGSGTGQSGVVHNNYSATTDTSSALFCTATLNFAMFENYVTGVLATQGQLFPVADNPA
jgi:hypothetical protein